MAEIDGYLLELEAFVEDIQRDEALAARKTWLHSRWYTNEQYFAWLDAAGEVNARMTFCFLGRDVPYRKAVIERMLNEGHEVATHGRLHYLVDERFGYDELYPELLPAIEQLRTLGATATGLWLGARGSLHNDAPQALVDLGIEWFSCLDQPAPDTLPDGLTWLPARWPHDVETLFYHPVSAARALETWTRMWEQDTGGAFLFHLFTLTMLEPEYMETWKAFMRRTGGSVTANEKTHGGSELPAIVSDASLHLATGRAVAISERAARRDASAGGSRRRREKGVQDG